MTRRETKTSHAIELAAIGEFLTGALANTLFVYNTLNLMDNKNDDSLQDVNAKYLVISATLGFFFAVGCAYSKRKLNKKTQIDLSALQLSDQVKWYQYALLGGAWMDGAIEFCAGVVFMAQLVSSLSDKNLFWINMGMLFAGLPAVGKSTISKVVATGVVLMWNFIGYKFLVFRKNV